MRSQFEVKFPVGMYSKIEYKIAESRDEIEQAFQLVQAAYLETNLTSDEQSVFRLSKYNALPTTTVFIAKYENEVIATVSQIMDTSLGLPIENFSNVDELRGSGKRISEISCLAVKKSWRSRSVGIFFPLTTYAIQYCQKVIGSDYAVIVTRASVRFFYQSLYGFKALEPKVKNYDQVNNMASFSQYLDLETLEVGLKEMWANKDPKKNLHYIYTKFPWKDQCQWSEKKYPLATDPALSGTDLDYFFNLKSNVFSELRLEDIKVLKSIYFYDNFTQVISPEQLEYANKRRFPRFQVNMKVQYKFNDQLFDAKIHEISEGGFAVVFEDLNNVPENLEGVVLLNDFEECGFVAKRCWNHGLKCGYFFLKLDEPKWKDVIEFSKNFVNNSIQVESEEAA